MKKFTKIFLMISGILLFIGIVLVVTACCMGVTAQELSGLKIGNIGLHFDGDWDWEDDLLEKDADHSGKMIFEDIRHLNIDSGAAVIKIYYAPVENTEVHYDKAWGISVERDDRNELDLECGYNQSGVIEVLIPEGSSLGEIDLDIGAGQVEIDGINFTSLDGDVGAGELIVRVPDAIEQYDYSVDCGIGDITIGNQKYSGIASTESYDGLHHGEVGHHPHGGIASTERREGSAKYFDIDCGAGKVTIESLVQSE